jgi:hypothetical protein
MTMKKMMTFTVLLVMTLLLMSSNPIHSEEQLDWGFCFMDVLYITEYQLDVEAGNVVRGQALAPGPSFPAPLTGYYNPARNFVSFSIGYLNDNSRHYYINGTTLEGWSWAIGGPNAGFLDGPRRAQLVLCTLEAAQPGEGETGAPE